MDRSEIAELWERAWTKGVYQASWEGAVSGMTAEQAAWKPSPERHSVLELVRHLAFWREYMIRKAAGDEPKKPEVERGNWERPTEVTAEVTDTVWCSAVERLEAAQRAFVSALRDGGAPVEEGVRLLAHDSYHFGQIMYLRAMQGLPPLENPLD